MSDFNPSREYELGLRGAYVDPREDEMLVDAILRSGGDPDGEHVASTWEFDGLGKGKLTAMWEHVFRVWPGCWPGPPQDRGDCVSWALCRAALESWTCELIDGKPDEVTGMIEGKPILSETAIANCVISSEAAYWWRGWAGEGWTGSGAARAVTQDCGIWLRQNYPQFKIDLTEYSGRTAGLWGAKSPPGEIREFGRQHLVRTATVIKDHNAARDFLAAGYGVFFTSMLAWSKDRDEFGFSSLASGSWAHAQALCGWDDRPEIIKKYGEPLACVLNSWGRWNRGGRKVYGTDLYIPEGAYWTKASTLARCQCIALSSVAGWPARKLTSYGAKGNV
jgi:hypothetical protein